MTYLEQAAASTRTEQQVRDEREKLEAAKGWRKIVWRSGYRNEDERLQALTDICVKLEDGNVEAGQRLATKAMWTP